MTKYLLRPVFNHLHGIAKTWHKSFENGLPKLSEFQSEEEILKWDKKPLKIELENKSNLGEDNIKLFFSITEKANLLVKCFNIQNEFLGEYNLGNIY